MFLLEVFAVVEVDSSLILPSGPSTSSHQELQVVPNIGSTIKGNIWLHDATKLNQLRFLRCTPYFASISDEIPQPSHRV